MKYIWKKCYKNIFGSIYFGCPCCSNGTKIHLDATLLLLSVLNMCYPNYPERAVGFRKCKDKQILLNHYFSMYFLTFIGLTFNGNKQTKKRWVESSDAITWWKPSQLKIFIKWWTNMEEECHIYQVIYIEIFLIINVFTIMISRSVYTKMQRGILHVSAASRRFLGILFSWS